jgi:hypothetical protein
MKRFPRRPRQRQSPTAKKTGSSASSAGAGSRSARSEHVEQREFVSWFRQTYTARIFAIPNGEARSRTAGARLKVEGVSPGVPDLCVPAWGLWIEMKRADGGVVSTVQADWHAYLASVGHTVIIGHGLADAQKKMQEWLLSRSHYGTKKKKEG